MLEEKEDQKHEKEVPGKQKEEWYERDSSFSESWLLQTTVLLRRSRSSSSLLRGSLYCLWNVAIRGN